MKGTIHATGLPARVLEQLVLDGGWLTTDGVCLLVPGNPRSVQRALHRLHRLGLVETRRRLLNERWSFCAEFRAVP